MPDADAPNAAQPAPSQGQSPPGSSPATMPVPNRGAEASAIAGLSAISDLLLRLVTQVGAGSDIGKDVLKSISLITKHIPPGSTAQGVQQSAMMKMMRDQQGQQPMAAMMQARGAQQAAPQAAQQPGTAAAA